MLSVFLWNYFFDRHLHCNGKFSSTATAADVLKVSEQIRTLITLIDRRVVVVVVVQSQIDFFNEIENIEHVRSLGDDYALKNFENEYLRKLRNKFLTGMIK